jgi:protein-S-isoprenylcysteine O-methyltransferase Ste14
MNRLWIMLRSIFYATLFLALWGAAALMTRFLDRFIPFQIAGWLKPPGLLLIAVGAAVSITTIGFFIFEGFGTPAVFDPPKRFVPHGPYRFVRNPMYIGGVLMLLGLGLILGSVSMALFAGVAFLLIHTFVVFAEEPGLRRRFGQEYEDYCRTVPRWIPRFRTGNSPV